MKVTLINPPFPRPLYSKILNLPPIGLAYLASVLYEDGIEVDAIDFTVEKPEEIRKKMRRKSDVWGITSVAYTYNSANAIARLIKHLHPRTKVVMGGHTVSSLYEKTLLSNPSVDAIVIGEGEYTFLDLVRNYEEGGSLEKVNGIAYRTKNSVKRNEDRELIENLDDLPFPLFKIFPLKRYNTFWRSSPLPISSSRGCMFNCEFCDIHNFYRGRYRERSPKNIVDEMEHDVEEYRKRSFLFSDDIFTLNKRRVRRICEEIKKRNLDITWACETRVDCVDKGLLKTMKESGCWAIFFGVESSSQETLNSMKKGITVEKTKKAFEACKEVGIRTCASMMLFYPTDDKRTVRDNIRFVKSLDPDIAYFAVTTPFPGTRLYEQLRKDGMIRDHNLDDYDTLTPVFETKEFKIPYMSKMLKEAYLSFYLNPLYLAKQLSRHKRDILDLILNFFKDYLKEKVSNLHFKLSDFFEQVNMAQE